MPNHLVLIDRETLRIELRTVFDLQTTDTLLRVLDKVADQIQAAAAPRTDFTQLHQIVARITEKLEQLIQDHRQSDAKFQQLHEDVVKLIEQQRRNEERFTGLEGDVTLGKLKQPNTQVEAYLAVEVSSGVDRNDVKRASQRAAWLRQAGFIVIPVAAGDDRTIGADEEAGR